MFDFISISKHYHLPFSVLNAPFNCLPNKLFKIRYVSMANITRICAFLTETKQSMRKLKKPKFQVLFLYCCYHETLAQFICCTFLHISIIMLMYHFVCFFITQYNLQGNQL